MAPTAKKPYVRAVIESKRAKRLTDGRVARKLNFADRQKTVISPICKGYGTKGITERMDVAPEGVKARVSPINNKLDAASNVEANKKIKEPGLPAEK